MTTPARIVQACVLSIIAAVSSATLHAQETNERPVRFTVGTRIGYGDAADCHGCRNPFGFTLGARAAMLLRLGSAGALSLGVPFFQTVGTEGERYTLVGFELGYETPRFGPFLLRAAVGIGNSWHRIPPNDSATLHYPGDLRSFSYGALAAALVYEILPVRFSVGMDVFSIDDPGPEGDSGLPGGAMWTAGFDYCF
jgi:hypothetical protein